MDPSRISNLLLSFRLDRMKRSTKWNVIAAAAALVAAGGAVTAYRMSSSSKATRRRQRKESGNRPEASKNPRSAARKPRASIQSIFSLIKIISTRDGERGLQILLSLLGLAVLRTTLSNRLARVQGFLFEAAFLRKVPKFIRLISENLILCLAQSVIISSSKYLKGSLLLHWRDLMTTFIHNRYFQDMVYYKMSYVDQRISSPEQRIASDVPRFCTEMSDLVQENIGAVCDALFYTYRLCTYAHPKYALGILAYVLGAGAITGALSPPFGRLVAEEQQQEGDYRQLHSRLRTHSESIAFYGGQEKEGSIISSKFRSLTRHVSKLLFTQWWFGILQDFLLKYCGATWAVVLIIGPFFGGPHSRLQSLQSRATTLSNMRYHTSVIISLFQAVGTLATSTRRVSRISGMAQRIQEMLNVCQSLSEGRAGGLGMGMVESGPYIEFENVTVETPTGNKLVENLSLKVEQGHNLLITGPNGSGKSSLFRVLGGLWPLTSGTIRKPGSTSDLCSDIFYVPQRPYMAVGTLFEQLIYPLTAVNITKPLTRQDMLHMLATVNLEGLVDRYPEDQVVNWGEELSLGEQQRLGMARLFYHSPAFAILDECTSAVTTDMEERFCNKVGEMGTTCVTISHRPALVAFHDTVLSLDGEGGWTVHYKRDGAMLAANESQVIVSAADQSERRTDASTNASHFLTQNHRKVSSLILDDLPHTELEIIASSPPPDGSELSSSSAAFGPVPVPQSNISRVATLARILMPKIVGKQGAQLGLLAAIVLSRTILSDRIASLNGATVDNMLQQDLKGFMRLIGVSILQSSASSVIAPSLKSLTAFMALGWRTRLTRHLCQKYFHHNAFYKAVHLTDTMEDADVRITQSVDTLCRDLSSLVTNLIKPLVDILWFTWRMKGLTGGRGVVILYAYMLLGLGFLRSINPDFAALSSEEQRLEGSFRYMHTRLRTHAESVAFFGGGNREKEIVTRRFRNVIRHSRLLLLKRWSFGIVDEFVTKQLPSNVTWVLSLLFALESPKMTSLKDEGQLAHDLRFLASVVSQSFNAFGDILEMYRKVLELAGGLHRVSELDELLTACQEPRVQPLVGGRQPEDSWQDSDEIVFDNVDIVTPGRKLLARKLSVTVSRGRSLLVTGPNGSGKSSLFRVLGGLWPAHNGTLRQPSGPASNISSPQVFYVPQRPYTAMGTLRDQIIYPLSIDSASASVADVAGESAIVQRESPDWRVGESALDRKLRKILEDVRLSYLLEREGGWDSLAAWEDILSLGEQQRLGMARLFFHCPKFGILDECTNATSVDVEEGLYKKAQEFGITVVTISQRPALIPYHSRQLRLIDGEGEWELQSI